MTRGRRAQQFHALVEGSSTEGARTLQQADLLELVGALRAVPPAPVDPAFVAALRERLIAEAETVLTAAAAELRDADERLRLPTASPQVRRRHRRLAAAVSGVVLVGASATMAYASQSALPGDGLYPVKRGLENARAELTFDQAARGRVVLDDAQTRLDEAQTLSRIQADPARVTDALDAFTGQAISGADLLIADYDSTGDRSSITSLRVFTASTMHQLDQLQGEIPPQSLPSLLRAAQALDQVQQTSLNVCQACRGPVVTEIPSVLAQATRATVDFWQVAVPHSQVTHQQLAHGDDGAPVLPHVGGTLPPASVTDPDSSTAPQLGDQVPTAGDVQHTVQHLTDGLTTGQQDDVASTVANTAANLLDAVGQVGNQVAGALGDTVNGLVPGLLPGSSPSP